MFGILLDSGDVANIIGYTFVALFGLIILVRIMNMDTLLIDFFSLLRYFLHMPSFVLWL